MKMCVNAFVTFRVDMEPVPLHWDLLARPPTSKLKRANLPQQVRVVWHFGFASGEHVWNQQRTRGVHCIPSNHFSIKGPISTVFVWCLDKINFMRPLFFLWHCFHLFFLRATLVADLRISGSKLAIIFCHEAMDDTLRILRP